MICWACTKDLQWKAAHRLGAPQRSNQSYLPPLWPRVFGRLSQSRARDRRQRRPRSQRRSVARKAEAYRSWRVSRLVVYLVEDGLGGEDVVDGGRRQVGPAGALQAPLGRAASVVEERHRLPKLDSKRAKRKTNIEPHQHLHGRSER